MVAIDAMYHSQCLVSLYNQTRQYKSTKDTTYRSIEGVAFAELSAYIASFDGKIFHAMNVIKSAVKYGNPVKVPVISSDQPLFTLAKQIQWELPNTQREDHLVVMFGVLYVEMSCGQMAHWQWLDRSSFKRWGSDARCIWFVPRCKGPDKGKARPSDNCGCPSSAATPSIFKVYREKALLMMIKLWPLQLKNGYPRC